MAAVAPVCCGCVQPPVPAPACGAQLGCPAPAAGTALAGILAVLLAGGLDMKATLAVSGAAGCSLMQPDAAGHSLMQCAMLCVWLHCRSTLPT